MKYLVIIISLFFLTGLTSQVTDKGISVAWKAGIFEPYDCQREAAHGNHQADRYVCGDYRLVNETDQIPMQVGVNFGYDYQIEIPSLTGCYTETRVLEHPRMTQPDGQVTTNYSRSYQVGNCPGGLAPGIDTFSWHIEKDWEAVKGDWVFKILVNGSQVISKKFTAY